MIDDVFKYPDDSVEGGTAGEALLMIQRWGHRRMSVLEYHCLLLWTEHLFSPFTGTASFNSNFVPKVGT